MLSLAARPPALDLGDLHPHRGPQRPRRIARDHSALRQEYDPVGRLGLGEIVGGEQDGSAAGAALSVEQRPDPLPVLGVEADGRLIEDEEVGLMQQGPYEVYDPAPTAGELPCWELSASGKTGPVEGAVDSLAGRPASQTR